MTLIYSLSYLNSIYFKKFKKYAYISLYILIKIKILIKLIRHILKFYVFKINIENKKIIKIEFLYFKIYFYPPKVISCLLYQSSAFKISSSL